MSTRQLEAVVFDLDGLMVNSEPLARQAWDEVLAAYGHRLDDETQAAIIGRRTRESAEIVRGRFALAVAAEELAAAKIARWESIWPQGLPVMPGLHRLHEALAARQVPWAVATSSPRHYATGVLAQLGLLKSCRALAGGDEVVHGKPAPDIYLLAAERLGIAPEACLALEDSEPGARAAQAAGMTVAAVPNGTPQEAFGFADYVMDSLTGVADRLDLLLNAGDISL